MKDSSVLEAGFRPFFLLGALWAAAVIALWVAVFSGQIAFALPGDPVAWHRHEMLYGFVGAIVAGFLLTAVPNWTGGAFLAGPRLAGMVLLWLLARGLGLVEGAVPGSAAAACEGALFLILAGWALQRIRAAGSRNMPIALLIAVFGLSGAVSRLAGANAAPEIADIAWRLGVTVVVLLLSLIGGRIVPAFTRNWLVQRAGAESGGLPVMFNRYDGATVLATLIGLAVWSILPDATIAGGLLLLAGLLHLGRLLRWSGWRTGKEPLVLVLHLSYLWMPAGLLLLAASILSPSVTASAALHALTAGAMGTMTLAVMTRASLGHTGRPLTAGPRELAIYALVHAGALTRVAASLEPAWYGDLLNLSGALWAGAFLLFALSYAPLLLRPARG